jgi:hypothetical protein
VYHPRWEGNSLTHKVVRVGVDVGPGHDDQDGQMWFHCPMCRADWPYAKTYSFRGANHLMRQHWPVGYDGEVAVYNEDDFRQIYDAYMEEKECIRS